MASIQSAYLGHGHAIVQPIDWQSIAAPASGVGIVTAVQVRTILNRLVANMNKHFKMVVAGAMMNSVAVTRDRVDNHGDETVYLSVWRCRTLFGNHKVQLRWTEHGKQHSLFMSLFDIWLKSSQRSELYSVTSKTRMPAPLISPVLEWLEHVLGVPDELCPVRFDRFNRRRDLLDDMRAFMPSLQELPAKKIWSDYYNILPESRPPKGRRIRMRGHDVIFVPSKERIRSGIAYYRHQLALEFRF